MKAIVKPSRAKQIDTFISLIHKSGKVVDIHKTLSIITAYTISGDTYEKYFPEWMYEDIIKMLQTSLENGGNGHLFYEEEEAAWNAIIDTLGVSKILDIINNPDRCLVQYDRIIRQIEELKDQLLEGFAAREVMRNA